MHYLKTIVMVTALIGGLAGVSDAQAQRCWSDEFPKADFSRHSVPLGEIQSGGPPRDGIPSIDDPEFTSVANVEDIGAREPVVSIATGGEAKAYPFRILMFHEIVNDRVADMPVAVTFCPLCNSAMVFHRRVGDRILEFGTTGKLRNSGLVMYDRQTESFWQQFTGRAIVGTLTDTRLQRLPARIESFERFARRHPAGRILLPPSDSDAPYGLNPYTHYDSAQSPWIRVSELPEDLPPLARVVNIGGTKAFALSYLRDKGQISDGDLILHWTAGQNSALDDRQIERGWDVGNVTVQRRLESGEPENVVYSVDFAFAFKSFHPDSPIITG